MDSVFYTCCLFCDCIKLICPVHRFLWWQLREPVLFWVFKKRRLSYHSPVSSVEESPDDIVFLLLCFLNSICAALPCPVALCSQTGEQKMGTAPRGSDAGGTCICRDGAGVTVTVTAWGLLHEQSSVCVCLKSTSAFQL